MDNKLSKEQQQEFNQKLRFVNKHMKKLKFTNIPLVRIIIFENAKIIVRKYKEERQLSPEEIYVYELNNSITAIVENFRDIELFEIFLQERLKDNIIIRKGVTDPEYIRYHMENYFIRIHKIKDQVCMLLKNYFKLNYKENNSLEYRLINDEFLKAISLNTFISYFNESLSKLKPVRNQIAHKSNLESSDLGMLEAILLSKGISARMRKTYSAKKESQIRYFAFLSEKNRKIFYEAILSMLIILNQKYIPDFEKHSGIKIADQIAAMMKQID